ncbi:hypothetical protein OU5_5585 [Pseudomonas mandelii JR-1]|uniref:Uncharacterized protein n=1 Tax=Pseudomonas mandelii JR-1 TaxID=1147786 RepID=A0A024EI75_9PSED|nr:hypothetical protein OU5_5585 [Pseudomonas mandelii JR-1]
MFAVLQAAAGMLLMTIVMSSAAGDFMGGAQIMGRQAKTTLARRYRKG